MQDSIAAGRIIELGAPPDRVSVTGNMKFDIIFSINVRPELVIRKTLGLKDDDDLIVAGSTHGGEEEILVETFKRLSADFKNLRLMIAPRHIDRVGEIETIIQRTGFGSARVSQLNKCPVPGTKYPVLILDTIGQLNDAYSIATLVFIGGSLVKHGGHNPIEPACFSKPIFFGPNMFNFKYIAAVFLKNKAAMQVFNKEDLYEKSRLILNDANTGNRLGQNAKKIISMNKGATGKNIAEISGILT
jgi:3-deoxy-D-manno-octulosonic-acid transferase